MDWLLPEIALAPPELPPCAPEWPHPAPASSAPLRPAAAAAASDTLMAELLSSLDSTLVSSVVDPGDRLFLGATRAHPVSPPAHPAISAAELAPPRPRKPPPFRPPPASAALRIPPSHGHVASTASSGSVLRRGDGHDDEEDQADDTAPAGGSARKGGKLLAREVRAIRRREFHKIHTRRSRAKLNDKMDKLLAALPAPPPGVVIKSKAQILDYAISVLSARYSACAHTPHHGHTSSS